MNTTQQHEWPSDAKDAPEREGEVFVFVGYGALGHADLVETAGYAPD